MAWYYAWFPTTVNFLASGALVTGEASPGYLPYPDVAHLVQTKLPGTKIIMVGRQPLDRSWSSYRYNYVTPTIEHLKRGLRHGIPPNQSDEYYQSKYLFTFEEMMSAELQQLRKCLLQGVGANATEQKWYAHGWARTILEQRKTNDNDSNKLPPLIDLDETCYGGFVNRTVLREQWADLQMSNPQKLILPRNLHLTQALLGRSLYVYPLEWWYTQFSANDIYFMCTEELSDLSGTSLNELAMKLLGLPSFNFSAVVAEGAYNVGGHRGYDLATSWEQVQKEHGDAPIATKKEADTIPLSPKLQKELQAFLDPINERLFSLTGRRCDW